MENFKAIEIPRSEDHEFQLLVNYVVMCYLAWSILSITLYVEFAKYYKYNKVYLQQGQADLSRFNTL